MKNKIDYIANRYVTMSSPNQIRYINGYNILKGKRIARPFTAFYPNPEKRYKETID